MYHFEAKEAKTHESIAAFALGNSWYLVFNNPARFGPETQLEAQLHVSNAVY
jgi:hypothetical protein